MENSSLQGGKPTGCFNFRTLFESKNKTPLVLRKSKSNKYEVVHNNSDQLPFTMSPPVVSHVTNVSSHNKTEKSKHHRLTLPDVVAATTKVGSQDSQQQQHHHHKHRHKEFEELAEENQRLKSIFQLHSIKISENTKSRRNSDPDLYTNSSCDKNKRSSLSSDSSSTTKCDDAKTKKATQRRKKQVMPDTDTECDHDHSKRLSGDISLESKEISKDSSKLRTKSHSSKDKISSSGATERLTAGDVAQSLLHRSEKNNFDKKPCSSLPSSPQTQRKGGHGGSLASEGQGSRHGSLTNSTGGSHGGSLNNILNPPDRRGSKGIIKPSVQKPVFVSELDHLHSKVGYSNYNFYDSCSRPGFVFIGSSGHVVAECSGHPSNSKIIVKTIRESTDIDDNETEDLLEEEFDEEKIYASQKLRQISLKLESLKNKS